MLDKIASRRVASICFGYRGLTCLALVWFVPTPPEWSAIMKVVYYFYKVLLAGAGKDEDSAAVTNAAAIVLKQRDKAMSLVQYITGLTLKMGKTSKQVR